MLIETFIRKQLRYGLNWKSVATIVKRAVKYGLKHRARPPVHVIGIDEVSRRKGQVYLTVVYDLQRRRLLWVGDDRTEEAVRCFLDARNPIFVEHSVEQLVSQRVYGLALGYEELNDHEQLRQDPLLRVLAGKANVEDSPLAGKSTLNRLELSDGTPNRYKKITFWKDSIDELLVKAFLEAHAGGNRPGSGCHRFRVAWRAGGAIFPRLL